MPWNAIHSYRLLQALGTCMVVAYYSIPRRYVTSRIISARDSRIATLSLRIANHPTFASPFRASLCRPLHTPKSIKEPSEISALRAHFDFLDIEGVPRQKLLDTMTRATLIDGKVIAEYVTLSKTLLHAECIMKLLIPRMQMIVVFESSFNWNVRRWLKSTMAIDPTWWLYKWVLVRILLSMCEWRIKRPTKYVYCHSRRLRCLCSLDFLSKRQRKAGMQFTQKNLPETTKQSEILALIHSLNQDPLVHGIIVQSPIQCVSSLQQSCCWHTLVIPIWLIPDSWFSDMKRKPCLPQYYFDPQLLLVFLLAWYPYSQSIS